MYKCLHIFTYIFNARFLLYAYASARAPSHTCLHMKISTSSCMSYISFPSPPRSSSFSLPSLSLHSFFIPFLSYHSPLSVFPLSCFPPPTLSSTISSPSKTHPTTSYQLACLIPYIFSTYASKSFFVPRTTYIFFLLLPPDTSLPSFHFPT